MSADGPSPPTFPGVTAYEAELSALGGILQAARGTFSLSLAVCNDRPLRDALFDTLRRQHAGIEYVELTSGFDDVYAAVDRAAAPDPAAVFVTGIESGLRSDPEVADGVPDESSRRILLRLNGSRELWKERFNGPVVFWLPLYAGTLLMRFAPDWWSWVSHHLEFTYHGADLAGQPMPQFAGDLLLVGNLDAQRKQFRLAELRERLREFEDQAAFSREDATVWYNEAGYLYWQTGDLDQAERMHRKALEINEKLGRLEGMAAACGNLGLIHQTRGDLDQAERMHRKSLAINEKLGHLEGMAIQYGNLGLIHQTRGELDEAERMHRKALAIDEKLGRLEGMATDYGNLGLIHETRGELDDAERMHRKALEIDEKLGYREGMARHFGNLGLVHGKRGELDEAERMLHKALEIDEKLGRLEGMAHEYGNLGAIHQARGELDDAERMHRKGLAINQKLGRLEGIAINYDNLGSVYKGRGDASAAREFWTKSRDLYARIGMPHMVECVQGLLDALDDPPAASE